MSGNNCYRAHSSESEDLGSVTKSEVVFELPIFQGRSSGIEVRGERGLRQSGYGDNNMTIMDS